MALVNCLLLLAILQTGSRSPPVIGVSHGVEIAGVVWRYSPP